MVINKNIQIDESLVLDNNAETGQPFTVGDLIALVREDGDKEEQAYLRGQRTAYLSLLSKCIRELGYDSQESQQSRWIMEREQAIISLRDLCKDFGDNDWDSDLHLSDIIDKHLGEYLGKLT